MISIKIDTLKWSELALQIDAYQSFLPHILQVSLLSTFGGNRGGGGSERSIKGVPSREAQYLPPQSCPRHTKTVAKNKAFGYYPSEAQTIFFTYVGKLFNLN